MKYIIIASLLCTGNIYAAEVCSEAAVTEQKEINTDVPNHLKGATIIVRQIDGKESSVPAEKFKVVPRKQQFLVTKSTVSCKASEKNRLSGLVGYGPTGSLHDNKGQKANSVRVDTKEGAVGGLQVQRKISNRLSVGAQGQTNKTMSFVLGVDF